MKYSIATIRCNDLEEWQVDILMQQLADQGFDSFEQDGNTLRAYIPTELVPTLDLSALDVQLSIADCPDENWNAVWEANHEIEELPLGVRITPHCAFGAGHHETTSMMINALLNCDLAGKRVYDHGTGTGVLAIFAAKLGAAYVLADDIDDNSIANARENAEANQVDIHLVRAPFEIDLPAFDLIVANIHRNIHLAQMSEYARLLAANGELWLSGFYEADVPILIDAARAQGLHPVTTHANSDWRMIICRK